MVGVANTAKSLTAEGKK